MDSKADSLLLSYKDNPELKAQLAGYQPGDSVTVTLTVSVRANDDDAFDALIDDIEVESDTIESEDEASEDEGDDEVDPAKDPVLVVVAGKKPKK